MPPKKNIAARKYTHQYGQIIPRISPHAEIMRKTKESIRRNFWPIKPRKSKVIL
jgi:hypothetical protein